MDTNANWLTQRILALAMFRTGHPDQAADDMEKHLDNSIKQLSMSGYHKSGSFHPEQLPSNHLRALQAAKVYADAGYRDVFAQDALSILDTIEPVSAIKACAPALRELHGQVQK